MVGAVHNVAIWMLITAAASSWLVPTVIATGDVDEGRAESTEYDVVVDRESTVAGASSIEYEESMPDDDKNDDDVINEDEKSEDEKEEKVNEYTGHTGLQIWPDGKYNKITFCSK